MSEHKTVRWKGLSTHKTMHKPRFKKLCRFIVLLFRTWRIHSHKVKEVLNFYQTLNLIADTSVNKNLMFDITEYRTTKEAKTSSEVKRILQKRVGERTTDELHFVQIALRKYKSLAEYPVRMQRGIAYRAWYQRFDAKRVIIREGHVPMMYYFILSGSAGILLSAALNNKQTNQPACPGGDDVKRNLPIHTLTAGACPIHLVLSFSVVVTVMDMESNQERTVLFLGRGDCFGDDAIINKCHRCATVISKEVIELLVLTDEDFVNIFMSGGLASVTEVFLKGIPCLDGWPQELLHDSPKKAILNYFKRGTVILKDSKDSEWIVIVKSGSCNLLKKLRKVNPRRRINATIENWREKRVTGLRSEAYLSHEERLQISYQQQIQHLQQINQRMRFNALPEINVASSEEYKEMKKLYADDRHDSVSDEQLTFVTTADQGLAPLDTRSTTGTSVGTENMAPLNEGTQEGSMKKKTPVVSKSRLNSRGKRDRGDQRALTAQPRGQRRSSVTFPDTQDYKGRASSAGDLHVFINVQTLTKGSVFGISDLFYKDQPNFALTSNGVECLLINKKFFLDNASNDFMVKLRDETLPYPSEEDLQRHLEERVIWDHHKKQTVSNVLREIHARRPGRYFQRVDRNAGFTY
ncbi:cyclic nucleotide-binding domain-containing protein 2-like [Haliotis cracherodii]|uniref:cyclic nucleotide-binding domain-containing protein 2-like n=1 Tax=Haliotis cracherodii TaxID=6455 RepID=UPI0039E94273